jgi:hypothetical protein
MTAAVGHERYGRVEVGLGKEFVDRPDIGPAERVALRAQARAVDGAETARDYLGVSTANRVYLELRQAAGLCAGTGPVADSFTELLAELGRADAGVRHSPD